MLFLCSENREKPLSEVITTVAPHEVRGHRGACLLGPGPPRRGKHVLLPGTEVTHACEAVSPRAPFARRSWLPTPGGSSAETNQMLPRALRGRPWAGTPGLPPPAGLRVPVTPAEDQIRDICPSGCLRGRPTGKACFSRQQMEWRSLRLSHAEEGHTEEGALRSGEQRLARVTVPHPLAPAFRRRLDSGEPAPFSLLPLCRFCRPAAGPAAGGGQ